MRGGEEGMREGVLLVLVVGGGWGGKWMGRRDVHLHAEGMVCGEVEGDGVGGSGGTCCGGEVEGELRDLDLDLGRPSGAIRGGNQGQSGGQSGAIRGGGNHAPRSLRVAISSCSSAQRAFAWPRAFCALTRSPSADADVSLASCISRWYEDAEPSRSRRLAASISNWAYLMREAIRRHQRLISTPSAASISNWAYLMREAIRRHQTPSARHQPPPSLVGRTGASLIRGSLEGH